MVHSVSHSVILTHSDSLVDKFAFFKSALPDPLPTPPSTPSTHAMAKAFINRHNPEINSLLSSLRPNRPKPSRLLLLQSLRDDLMNDYTTGPGIEMPDVDTVSGLLELIKWDGKDYNALMQLKMIRVRHDDTVDSTIESH